MHQPASPLPPGRTVVGSPLAAGVLRGLCDASVVLVHALEADGTYLAGLGRKRVDSEASRQRAVWRSVRVLDAVWAVVHVA